MSAFSAFAYLLVMDLMLVCYHFISSLACTYTSAIEYVAKTLIRHQNQNNMPNMMHVFVGRVPI